jgi:mitochondrial fission protein ELM1
LLKDDIRIFFSQPFKLQPFILQPLSEMFRIAELILQSLIHFSLGTGQLA